MGFWQASSSLNHNKSISDWIQIRSNINHFNFATAIWILATKTRPSGHVTVTQPSNNEAVTLTQYLRKLPKVSCLLWITTI